ncbi:MAG: hypothetical protein ACPL07_00540 [Candidatus Bathyarchaeia archaeon]
MRYVVLYDRFILDILIDLVCGTKDYQLPKRLVDRILLNLWFLLVVKGIFKKKLIVGPASFSPFNSCPS